MTESLEGAAAAVNEGKPIGRWAPTCDPSPSAQTVADMHECVGALMNGTAN